MNRIIPPGEFYTTTSKESPLSVYIHWPFCLSLCPYCDFNSHIASNIDQASWANSYIRELEYFLPQIKDKKITSVFFGGGTPSLMDPKIVTSILEFLAKNAILGKNTEVTLEANPTSVESTKFAEFKATGINRLSLGIQSLIDEDLKILGRKHDSKEALAAINIASHYFDNYSFDLIYARPNQSLEAWENELKQALSLASCHISLYQLTIEKGTPFYKAHKEGKLSLPDNELAAEMYILTNKFLEKKNLVRYEISNYAQKGFECLHNLSYWRYQDYLGIGPGAHSRLNGTAIMMLHNPLRWQEAVSSKGCGIQKKIELTKAEKITEIIMMGLRIAEGISKQEFLAQTGVSFKEICNKDYLNLLLEKGFIYIENERYKLSNEGLNLHNHIVPRLIKESA